MAEMKAYNMVNTAGCYNINTGGRVEPFNDTGRTHTVVYEERPEPNWKRKERQMTSRARTCFPSPREAALERELWNQMTGHNRTAVNVSPKLAADYAAFQTRISREDLISRQLFDQINAR